MATFNEDIYVNGALQAKQMIPSPASILDAHVAANANIATSKLVHKYRPDFFQSGNAAAVTVPIHVVQSAAGGILQSFKIGCDTAATTTAIVTVDLKRNGTSILAAVIQLDSVTNKLARTLYAGAPGISNLVQGDWLDVVITAAVGVSSGTLPTGMYCVLEVDEQAV